MRDLKHEKDEYAAHQCSACGLHDDNCSSRECTCSRGGDTGVESGISVQANVPAVEGTEIKDAETDQVINKAGTYTMSGDYAHSIIINTYGDVTIKVEGDINFTNTTSGSTSALLRVEKVGNLAIENDGHTVKTAPGNKTKVLYEAVDARVDSITVSGGTYSYEGISRTNTYNQSYAFQFLSGGEVEFKNVTMTADDGGAVYVGGDCQVTLDGGSYTNKPKNVPAVWVAAGSLAAKNAKISSGGSHGVSVTGGTARLTNVEIHSTGSNAVAVCGGSATIDGGKYTSDSSITVYIERGARATILDGSIEFKGTNSSRAIGNEGILYFKGGTVTAPYGSAITNRTNSSAYTEITGGTIQQSKIGIEVLDGEVALKNAAFDGNENDIYLAEEKTITVAGTFTGRATVKVGDSAIVTPRQITTIVPSSTANQKNLNLVSNDTDADGNTYFVGYNAKDNYRYLTQRTGYAVTTVDAVAMADTDNDGTQETLEQLEQINATTTVTLTAAAAPAGQQFDHWELMKGNEDKTTELLSTLTEEERKEATVTFAMPEYDLLAKAVYANIPTPDPEPEEPAQPADDAGAGVAIVLGGVAIGATAYVVGTQLWLETHLPDGVIPTSRQQLADLLWTEAGKPQPASAALYADISAEAADSQAAARWCVEQGLMADYGENFKPDAYVFRPQVIKAWNDVQALR